MFEYSHFFADAEQVEPVFAALHRVVVLDDDRFSRQVMSAMFARIGVAQVDEIDDPRKLLDHLSRAAAVPDLLLLDLRMPSVDGVTLLRPLAEMGYAGGVIVFSGASEDVLDMALRLGASFGLNMLGALKKPPRAEALLGLLQKLELAPLKASPLKVVDRCASASREGSALREAIGAGQMRCVYQPKVRLRERSLVGAEALVRWHHPTDGIIPPSNFVTLAEQIGLIGELTRVVVEQAVAQAARWRVGGRDFVMSINVSALNLCESGFVEWMVSCVRGEGVSPAWVCLEITESHLGGDPLLLAESLTRLRLHGFRLSIDDFGTGFSSMRRLRDIAFDELKIDRGFTHGAATDPRRAAVFRASVRVARDLGIEVVAEGIENRADWDFSLGNGAGVGQGYFISRPLSADAFENWCDVWMGRNTKPLVSLAMDGLAMVAKAG